MSDAFPTHQREPISKDEAVAALRACAWAEQVATCGHTGCQDHRGPGPKQIHTVMGSLGCDWDLAAAETAVRDAAEVRWQPQLFRHDLMAVAADGSVICFEAQPQPGQPAVRS